MDILTFGGFGLSGSSAKKKLFTLMVADQSIKQHRY